MPDKTEKLKPCPFCGNKENPYIDFDRYGTWYVKCIECSGTMEGGTEEIAIRDWNKRAKRRDE